MNHDLKWRRFDLEEQLRLSQAWAQTHRHLDGWEINRNRIVKAKYLHEMDQDYGPITVPHRQR